MKNCYNIKKTLQSVVAKTLNKHHENYGTYNNLDWFNASVKTTDFYIGLNKLQKVS